ncbi:MAG: GNAT family N-acetyltransferase [Actinomycetia bacterium]|nr:GNAT family N-acetyltransferase [Actinomycetes bacterium]
MSLRPLAWPDVGPILQWGRDPEVARLAGRGFAAEHDAYRWWMGLKTARDRIGWAIEIDGRLVGDVELEHIRWTAGEAEVRICIGDRRYWDRGYGTRALALVLHEAFGPLGLGLVYLRVLDSNRRAMRSYEKLGFRKRGRLPATGRLAGAGELVLMELDRDAFRARYGDWPSASFAGRESTAEA